MTIRAYKYTTITFALLLIAAILIPFIQRDEMPRLALAPDNRIAIGCATRLTVEIQEQQATLRCAAPSGLTIGPTQPAIQPTTPASSTTAASTNPDPARAARLIFEDQLDSAWSNWSWGGTIDLAANSAHAGSAAIAVTPTDGWSGL
jgi:hypothetical protein